MLRINRTFPMGGNKQMIQRGYQLPLGGAVLVLAIILMTGCSSWRTKEEPDQFTYEESEIPPLVQPETVPAHEFLRQTPSGRLYSLKPARIAIVALPNFAAGTDPKSFLRNEVTQAKSQGSSFLPLHYYVAPDGTVFEGQSIEYAGDLAGKRVEDAVLVGVMGDYDQPASFMPPAQETILVQLCAWLCSQHSITPSRIVPATQVSPEATPLGANLMNWFGPTDMLRARVRQTLQKAADEEARAKDSLFAPFKKDERHTPDINDIDNAF